MRDHGRLVFAALLLAALLAGASKAEASPADFTEPEYVFEGMSEVTNLEFASDGRVFIARQNGLIQTAASVDSVVAGDLWDGRTETHNFWDRGLLGMAIHPDFPLQPYLYALYTHGTPLPPLTRSYGDSCPTPPGPTADGCVVSGKLVRLRLNQSGTSVLGTTVMIHDWCQQFPSHSIGDLAFGADGALYVSAGDGASFNGVDYGQFGGSTGSPTPTNPCGDPVNEGGALRAQDLRTSEDAVTPDGAVLRINPLYDPSTTGSELALPDNPNIAHSDPIGKLIVAHGLRNPFRLTFRPGTDELYIADVGWGAWEELNLHPAPTSSVRNYGWPCYEGGSTGLLKLGSYDNLNLPICENLYIAQSSNPNTVRAPLYAYHHNYAVTDTNGPTPPNSADGCPPAAPPAPVTSSITGLAFYEGGNYPGEYVGALFGGDYSRDCIWVIYPDATGRPDPSTIEIFHQEAGLGPVDLEMGPDGNIYFVNRNSGKVGRFRWTGENTPPTAVLSASAMAGNAPLDVTLDGSGSFDADGHPIVAYEWDLDGNGSFETSGAVVTHTFGPGSHTVRLRVRDFPGLLSTVKTVTINASNSAPSVQLTAPSAITKWAVGDPITFGATAIDPEEGTLPAGRFEWDLIIHHCAATGTGTCHEHHVQSWDGVSNGSFSAPDHGYPSHLELKVTVTDMYGLTAEDSVEIDAKTAKLRLESDPAGVIIGAGETAIEAPYEIIVIVGSRVGLSAPLTHTTSGQQWHFSHWSQGGANNQSYTAPPTDTTLTAHYQPPFDGDGVGLADRSTGKWYLRDPQTGQTTSFYYGNPGDIPFMGDWNCDGVATPGLYRQSDGFVYLRNSNTQGVANVRFFFGNPGDIPIAGDFNDDGCDTVSIYRPSSQRFYIINKLGSNDGGLGAAEFSYIFGNPGDKPFVGDFNGDGIDTIGLHRESTGLVYFRNSHTQGTADAQFIFGNPGDRLVAGKWADAGNPSKDTVAVFRPSTGMMYLKFSNTQGIADLSFAYGSSSMWPVAGDFGNLPGGSAPPPN